MTMRNMSFCFELFRIARFSISFDLISLFSISNYRQYFKFTAVL